MGKKTHRHDNVFATSSRGGQTALTGRDQRTEERAEVHRGSKMENGAINMVGSHPTSGKFSYCVSTEEREGDEVGFLRWHVQPTVVEWIWGHMNQLVYLI